MKGTAVATALALGASTALAAPSSTIKARDDVTAITVKGNAFFKGDDRFYIRGVDYQPGGSSKLADPIADADGCKRDIEKFKELGLNTIRVYSVDNSKDHDECMNALADAGIYLVLDVNTPKYSLNRADPAPSYNDVYLQYIFATVDKFANYKNTLAFFSGNEVINDGPSSKAAPYVKAVTRDLRQYIRSRNYREIPVGYSAADIDTNRLQMAEYMNCGTDDERSDFFAFNDYSWCDPSSFTTSGWDQKVKNFTGYGLPLFLSEYGCNTNKREFEEVSALYDTKMTGVYSGGLVYEYSQESSNYGLVEIDGNNVKTLSDYDALKSAYSKTSNPEGDGGYNKTGGANPCPAKDSPNWDVDGDSLPAIPEPAKKYMTQGAGKGAGFSGSGSMNAGTQSTSTATPGSGSVSSSSSSSGSSGTSTSSTGAAAGLQIPGLAMAPVMVGLVTVLSTVFGAGLVLL
ncbi:1,3-beta-glucanosyltransferase gel1 [Aspergillus luchuensis]|uniref:1,3-beta-glucanosyltransferase n=3 Tax=Aspergillus subgen. Circumdati TaxID=2720871 RepID=A0A146F3Z4_ASPKA|nr:1,3-beta-glucanosyltransferase Gel1 [Aspergillus piperis CBS 112811]XP_041547922.1 beta-glucanosyltransferase [Aspergillus luchuensis]OJZ82040.1 glycoside hydrolase family 72 protein [Aspergillus luchuensis CBS 106.47]GAA91859.1 1,3-beta-glucanosyltransferase Gel1 [Aspergillus luchuensis IFO 4308]RAH56664.1 1,3-beta-glucanosyltransferase Gel1 [Aspergillus piperis CBS 112811]BCS04160.1 beta-glucanosyltransferase [Aspergillus luchuensis]BCS15755.1 beta-glucanosyltransferase [Aspergillus luch